MIPEAHSGIHSLHSFMQQAGVSSYCTWRKPVDIGYIQHLCHLDQGMCPTKYLMTEKLCEEVEKWREGAGRARRELPLKQYLAL